MSSPTPAAAAARKGVIRLDTLLLRLHTETACRRGGALALRPADLDPDQCLILLREKGETVRWQPVFPTLMTRLVQHGQDRHAPDGGQLLRYADGRPITSRRYDHLWARIGRQLPWVRTQQISTHWIRHTTLTWVEGRGVASDATFRVRREAGAVRAADSVLPLPQPIMDGKVQVRQAYEGEVAAGDSMCHRVLLHRRTA